MALRENWQAGPRQSGAILLLFFFALPLQGENGRPPSVSAEHKIDRVNEHRKRRRGRTLNKVRVGRETCQNTIFVLYALFF